MTEAILGEGTEDVSVLYICSVQLGDGGGFTFSCPSAESGFGLMGAWIQMYAIVTARRLMGIERASLLHFVPSGLSDTLIEGISSPPSDAAIKEAKAVVSDLESALLIQDIENFLSSKEQE